MTRRRSPGRISACPSGRARTRPSRASDLTLVSGDLRGGADAIRLSRRTLQTIKGNLFWAFAYNVVLVPVAMLGFLNPLLVGAATDFSSLFVVSNSLRLRRFRAERATVQGSVECHIVDPAPATPAQTR